MAIVNEFPDLDALTAVAGEARSADFNKLRDAVEYLANPPYCAVRLTETQEVQSNTDHTVTWALVEDSHGDMFDPIAPTVLSATRAGVYDFGIGILFATSSDAGKRAVFLEKTSGGVVTRLRGLQVPAVDPSELSVMWRTNLAELDSVKIKVRQLSGGPLDLQPLRTVMIASWVRKPPATGE